MREQNVAEHSFQVAILAGVLAEDLWLSDYETARLLKMALVHDLEEIYTGDIPTPLKAMGAINDSAIPYKAMLGRFWEWVTGKSQLLKDLLKLADQSEAIKYLTKYGTPGDPHVNKIRTNIETRLWDDLKTYEGRHPGLRWEAVRVTLSNYISPRAKETQLYEYTGVDIQSHASKVAGE